MTDPLDLEVQPVLLQVILPLRDAYRRAMSCQIVHDSYHARGFTDSYALRMQGEIVGYGSVAGDPHGPREIIKEFYVLPACRAAALPLFRGLIAASAARWIETQTNDVLLTLLLFDCAVDVKSEKVLFADAFIADHPPPGVVLRPLTDVDRTNIFPHAREPVGEWGLDLGGEIVATGGLLYHYNPPYGDIYLEVAGPHQRSGFGSYLVQELKRICYAKGCVPSARCDTNNLASRLTLERAGMLPCARIVRGRIAT